MSRKKFVLSLVATAAALIAWPAASAQQTGAKDLLAGAAWTFSADGGKTFTLDSLQAKPPGQTNFVARATFRIDDPAQIGGLWLIPGQGLRQPSFTLNGKDVAGPLPRMTYRVFPMDPEKYLVRGENVLVARGAVVNKGQAPVPILLPTRLEAYPPQMVGIRTGPILGAIAQDYFTVTCRTNMPAKVVVTARPVEPAGGGETSAASQRGFYHRLRVPIPKGTRKFSYTVTSHAGQAKKTDGPITVKVPALAGEPFRFVAAGDSRSDPKVWGAVTAAIEKAAPDLLVHSGDLVGDGRIDDLWDSEFYSPAAALLSGVPFYPVLGNHEHNAPAYFELFYTPGQDGKGRNWAQAVGGVLFIGIDGAANWGAEPSRAWLEGVLKGSKEKFIFLATHYPAWSSSQHGSDRGAQKLIMPLLAKYSVTAMLAGHDHVYERSEPPADRGVTCIVTGGAGAPIYGKGRKANPYSKVFASKPHYCVFDVKGDACQMKVYDLKGRVIDERTFTARKVP